MLALSLAACSGRERVDDRPKIGDEPIDDRMIELVAKRDGLSHDDARAHVIETLRWAAAADRSRPPETPELDPVRRDHLRRTALARLYLDDVFAPDHEPADIPADDPLVERARADPRNVRPEIVEVCQAIFEPTDKSDPARVEVLVADPSWRAKALPRAVAYAEHVRLTVPMDDAEACIMFTRNAQFEPKDGDGVTMRPEGSGGFDLDACAQTADDGSCVQPRFAEEWVDAVRPGPIPGLRGPFFTRFGVHVVLVARKLPALPADDPGLVDRLRGVVHDAWRARELGQLLQSLRADKAVHVFGPGGAVEDTR